MSDSNVVSLKKVVFPQSDPESPLKGQNALLTGASYGIGAQIAAHLAAQGINIAITARSRDKLEALAEGAAEPIRGDHHRHSSRPHEAPGQREHSSRGKAGAG